jgi:hypothetical protein
MAPRILTLVTNKGEWPASGIELFIPGKEPHCPLDKWGGLQSVSGHCSYGKNLFFSAGNRTPIHRSSRT